MQLQFFKNYFFLLYIPVFLILLSSCVDQTQIESELDKIAKSGCNDKTETCLDIPKENSCPVFAAVIPNCQKHQKLKYLPKDENGCSRPPICASIEKPRFICPKFSPARPCKKGQMRKKSKPHKNGCNSPPGACYDLPKDKLCPIYPAVVPSCQKNQKYKYLPKDKNGCSLPPICVSIEEPRFICPKFFPARPCKKGQKRKKSKPHKNGCNSPPGACYDIPKENSCPVFAAVIPNCQKNQKLKYLPKDKNGCSLPPTCVSIEKPKLLTYIQMTSEKNGLIINKAADINHARLKNGAKLLRYEGVLLDGQNDYLDLGKMQIEGNKLTVMSWIKPKNLFNCKRADCRIISQSNGTREQDHTFMISTIRVKRKVRLRFRLKTEGKTSTLIASQGNLYNNRSYHVTAVYDGSKMSIYLNGNLAGDMNKIGNITTNLSNSVLIGTNNISREKVVKAFNGLIGDTLIFNKALKSDEIKKIIYGN